MWIKVENFVSRATCWHVETFFKSYKHIYWLPFYMQVAENGSVASKVSLLVLFV